MAFRAHAGGSRRQVKELRNGRLAMLAYSGGGMLPIVVADFVETRFVYGFRGLGFRGLGFRGLGFRGFGFWVLQACDRISYCNASTRLYMDLQSFDSVVCEA